MITEKEYELLKIYRDKGFKWIARNKIGDVYMYQTEPIRTYADWESNCYDTLLHRVSYSNCLFTYIKWEDEKPTKIDDLIRDYKAHQVITSKSMKVTVPQFIALWIEGIRAIMGDVSLFDAYDNLKHDIWDEVRVSETDRKMAIKICRWICDNPDIFIDAWRDGYEVEKEKLYTVRLANGDCLCRIASMGLSWVLTHQDYKNDKNYQLTQSEIESVDPVLMQLAEEVE